MSGLNITVLRGLAEQPNTPFMWVCAWITFGIVFGVSLWVLWTMWGKKP